MDEKRVEAVAAPQNGKADFKTRPCPICGKLAAFETRPFCSKRCADVDLHRWLGGAYAIPVAEDNVPGEDSSEDE
jgi:endogenous inhibitor of DNA gyrase (YacG/DUF329 family)